MAVAGMMGGRGKAQTAVVVEVVCTVVAVEGEIPALQGAEVHEVLAGDEIRLEETDSVEGH